MNKMILILLFLGLTLLHFIVPRVITEIRNPIFEIFKKKTIETIPLSYEKGKEITYRSFDEYNLKGFLTYAKEKNAKGTLILLHGIRSKKECFISLAERLSNEEFNTVAIDLRAHGKSEGTHCTFGVKEKKDVSALISYLEKEEGIIDNIGIWGRSLGGAVSIQAMGIDERIRFGIIESTFSDFNKITHDYFNLHLGFSFNPLTNYLIYRAGKIAGFDPDDAKPSIYARKIKQPIIMVHGTKDKRINMKHGKVNYDNLLSTQKKFIEFDEGNHSNIWQVGEEDYMIEMIDFIRSNCR